MRCALPSKSAIAFSTSTTVVWPTRARRRNCSSARPTRPCKLSWALRSRDLEPAAMPEYQWDFNAVLEYRDVLGAGIVTTLRVLALSVTTGIVLGLLLAPLRAAHSRWLRWPAQAIIEVVRSIPPLVLVVWAYYCLPILAGLKL